MRLSEADIKEFQAIWRAEFGDQITFAEARDCASQVLELYLVLAKHVARGEPEKEGHHGP